MGKVEKIVVLSVLFLIVLILAISLNTNPGSGLPTGLPQGESAIWASREADPAPAPDDFLAALEPDLEAQPATPVGPPAGEEAMPAPRPEVTLTGPVGDQDLVADAGPIEGSMILSEGAPTTLDAGFRDPRNADEDVMNGVPGILQSAVQTARPQETGAPAIQLEDDWDLRTTRGLRETVVDSFLIYTCDEGDTFEKLAVRYYGEASLAEVLRKNNEGMTRLGAGDELLVPVTHERGDIHVVAKNESLWAIADRYYGDGSRWPELITANTDRISDPMDLRAGMELRIP